MVYRYLGSVRVLLSFLLAVGLSLGHSGCSQNRLVFPEVVGGTGITVGLHLALLDFTADGDHSPLLWNLLGTGGVH